MSSIEWTDVTWNPTVGCSRVSPGCDNCYAINVAHRALQPAHEGLTIHRPGERTDWTGEVRQLPDRLATPKEAHELLDQLSKGGASQEILDHYRRIRAHLREWGGWVVVALAPGDPIKGTGRAR